MKVHNTTAIEIVFLALLSSLIANKSAGNKRGTVLMALLCVSYCHAIN